jgi:hypothetical protein
MTPQRQLITKRAWAGALVLIGLHFLSWWWVASENIQYDSRNILWWLVAFLIFPTLAGIVILFSIVRGLIGRRTGFGE